MPEGSRKQDLVTNLLPILLVASIVGVYASRINFVAPEVGLFLLPWFRHIVDHGPLNAFSTPFSNYTPPYLYLLAAASLLSDTWPHTLIIKLVSIFGTALLALSVSHLLKAYEKPRLSASLLIFLLPSVMINSVILSQCDAFWAAACVACVAAAAKNRQFTMLVWAGVALAFKAQAAFLAPFVFAILLRQQAPLLRWGIPLLVYVVAMLPAWLMGWPAADLATVYLQQEQFNGGAGSASNPWIFAEHYMLAPETVFPLGYLATLIATIAVPILSSKAALTRPDLVGVALISSMVVPFLLPQMHERFFFLADVLAFSYAYIVQDRRTVAIAILVQLSSLLALYGADLPRNSLFPMMGAGLMLIAIIATALQLRGRGHGEGASADNDCRCADVDRRGFPVDASNQPHDAVQHQE